MTISREEFRAYLAANPEKMFRAVSARECPLAGFLNRNLSEMFDRYTVTRERCRRRNDEWKTPEWANTFVQRVDRTRLSNQLITGAEALMVLDGVAAS